MEEIWIPIKNYEAFYEVSNFGKVKSKTRVVNGNKGKYIKTGRVLQGFKDKKGYFRVILSVDNKQKTYAVHRLVAEAFIPNPNKYNVINHKDENPSNNNVENLEWCTQKYNVNYGEAQIKRIKNRVRTAPLKKDNYRDYLQCPYDSIESVGRKKVYRFSTDGVLLDTYKSIQDAHLETGVSRTAINECVLGRTVSSGGYFWIRK